MRARTIAVGLSGAAYVLASHWLMTRAPASEWNAVVIIGPMLVLLAIYAWQRRQRAVAGIAVAAMLALLLQASHGGGISPAVLYLTQHVVIHAALAAAFASTLRAGHEPLITHLARRVHTRLTPDMVAYCRRVTAAWAIYFVAMAALSVALFAFAPFDAWAAFANLGTPLAMVAMFVGEYVLRYRLHPEFERATLGDAVRAYSQRQAVGDAAAIERDRSA